MQVRFWGYRRSMDGSLKDFVFLANWRGSASCRIFDALTGRMCSSNTARDTTYDRAYGSIYRECTPLPAPPGARAESMQVGLPASLLAFLQEHAGMEGRALAPDQDNSSGTERGMLAGTAILMNRALRVDDCSSRRACTILSTRPIKLDSSSLIKSL